MNEMKLIIELAPQDRELLASFVGAIADSAMMYLGKKAPAEPDAPKPKKSTAKKPTKAEAEAAVAQAAAKVVTEEPKPAEAPQLPVEEPIHEDQPVEAPAAVSLSELQKAITTFCVANPGKKAAVRDLVKQYGANVSSVPDDKRAEVLAKLETL